MTEAAHGGDHCGRIDRSQSALIVEREVIYCMLSAMLCARFGGMAYLSVDVVKLEVGEIDRERAVLRHALHVVSCTIRCMLVSMRVTSLRVACPRLHPTRAGCVSRDSRHGPHVSSQRSMRCEPRRCWRCARTESAEASRISFAHRLASAGESVATAYLVQGSVTST